MGVYLRKGHWQGRYRDQRFALKLAPGSKKADAEEALAKRISEGDASSAKCPHTLAGVIAAYMAGRGSKLKSAKNLYSLNDEGTVCGYARHLFNFFGPNTRLRDITPEKVFDYVQQRSSAISDHTKRPMTPCGVNKEIMFLSALFSKFAIKKGMVRRNPCEKQSVEGADDQARSRYLGQYGVDEEPRLKAACPGWVWDLAEFSLHTGLRLSEVLGLTWDKIDLDQRVLGLSKHRTKRKKVRLVPLNSVAMAVLERQGGIVTHTLGQLVFPRLVLTATGVSYLPYIQTSVSRAFGQAVDRAGLSKDEEGRFRFHDMRRTLATRLTNSDGIHVAATVIGDSIAVTERHYGHLHIAPQRAALEKMATQNAAH